MNCDEIFESLSEFIDEELIEAKCQEIRVHLQGCDNCQVVVDTLRRTVTLYREVPSPQLPAEARLKLHAVIRMAGGLD